VLLLRSAIFKPVFLNRFVMKVVSFATKVKQAHFCVLLVSCSSVVVVVCLVEGGLSGMGGEGVIVHNAADGVLF